MRIRGIIFDYGGTLDSRGDHWSEVIRRAYMAEGADSVGRDALREAYVHAERALDGSGIILPTDNFLAVMRKKIALQFSHLGLHDPKLCQSIAQRCYESARTCVEESRATLQQLATRYPLAIVSNFYGNIHAVLDDFGLLPHICAVIDSTEVGIRKPDPAIFRLGIDALAAHLHPDSPALPQLRSKHPQLRPDIPKHPLLQPDSPKHPRLQPDEVLVVGDSLSKDILPARSLGCHTALLPGIPWTPTAHSTTIPPDTIPSDTILLSSIADLLTIV